MNMPLCGTGKPPRGRAGNRFRPLERSREGVFGVAHAAEVVRVEHVGSAVRLLVGQPGGQRLAEELGGHELTRRVLEEGTTAGKLQPEAVAPLDERKVGVEVMPHRTSLVLGRNRALEIHVAGHEHR